MPVLFILLLLLLLMLTTKSITWLRVHVLLSPMHNVAARTTLASTGISLSIGVALWDL